MSTLTDYFIGYIEKGLTSSSPSYASQCAGQEISPYDNVILYSELLKRKDSYPDRFDATEAIWKEKLQRDGYNYNFYVGTDKIIVPKFQNSITYLTTGTTDTTVKPVNLPILNPTNNSKIEFIFPESGDFTLGNIRIIDKNSNNPYLATSAGLKNNSSGNQNSGWSNAYLDESEGSKTWTTSYGVFTTNPSHPKLSTSSIATAGYPVRFGQVPLITALLINSETDFLCGISCFDGENSLGALYNYGYSGDPGAIYNLGRFLACFSQNSSAYTMNHSGVMKFIINIPNNHAISRINFITDKSVTVNVFYDDNLVKAYTDEASGQRNVEVVIQR